MKEKWKEIIRSKLEGHRQPPPDGLWESISEQMGLQPETVRHPASAKKWYWAAAAAILVLGGFFALYHHESSLPSSPMASNTIQTDSMPMEEPDNTLSEKSTADSLAAPATTPSASPSATPILAMAHAGNTQTMSKENNAESKKLEAEKADILTMTAGQDMPDVAQNSEQKTVITQAAEQKSDIAQTAEQKSDIAHTSRQKSDIANTSEPQPKEGPITSFEPIRHSSPQRGKWTMGLNASGGLLAANNSDQFQMVGNSYMRDAYFSSKGFFVTNIVCESYETYTYHHKHHLPVRFGLNLNYQLSDRLALLSGINYTWLYSEFSNGRTQIDQHLHYLGIPVGIAYQLWSNPHLRIYLSGSAMLEKCLNEKPWQWSVNAGAGAEYVLTQQLGLYLEPSVGYYFDDGTNVEQYYKEHQLAPNIMLGVRMHINP